jgi:dCMP deaminase
MTGWTDHFLELAGLVASRSKDPSTKVGCVVVGPDKEIRATGYNGLPRGVQDLPARMERPAKYLWTSHAEENAVAHAALAGTSLKGCTAYVTHHPCSRCARSLIQAGVRRVIFGPGQTSMDAAEFEVARIMCEEADVALRRVGQGFSGADRESNDA